MTATCLVGEADPMRDEALNYGARLEAAGLREKTLRNNPKAAVPGKRMAELAKKKAANAAWSSETSAIRPIISCDGNGQGWLE